MKKLLALLLGLALCLSLAACSSAEDPGSFEDLQGEEEDANLENENGDGNEADGITVTVGATPAPHAEILEIAKDILADEGVTLVIREFTDYIQPNLATESGDLDANYFQHILYLDDFNVENGTHLLNVAEIHYEPFGLYAGKTASIDDLAEGAQIAVPNDATNEARALLLLEELGLIELADGVGLSATILDIVNNPLNLDIREIEAAQLPGTLSSVDMAVINGNYALDAGLSVGKDAVATENADSEAVVSAYANVLVVLEGNEDNEGIQALIRALTSERVRDYIIETYDGAVVPTF